MQISLKKATIAVCVIITVSYAFGRFSAPEKIKIETKIVEVEKKVQVKKSDTKKNYKKTKTEVTKPDGTKESTTVTELDTDTKTQDHIKEDKTTNIDQTKEITSKSNTIQFGFLVGANVFNLAPNVNPLVYGGYVNRGLIGPIRIGLFGLNSGQMGLSLGLQF